MNDFAIYRLPRQQACTLMEQTGGNRAETIADIRQLNGRSGFVIAPFAVSKDCPALLLQPDHAQTFATPDELMASGWGGDWVQTPLADAASESTNAPGNGRMAYHIDFLSFHAQLLAGMFQKIVLSRSLPVEATAQRPVDLFVKACRCFPDAFVSLFHTVQSGLWLMATPEILLEGTADGMATIALAGTMKAETAVATAESDAINNWSDKNREEQLIVSSYINQCLIRHATRITERGPVTARAANVVHLRTDFHFVPNHPDRLGDLLSDLYPTPAVCGLPKQAAYNFILRNEAQPRSYYSGFAGPLAVDGESHLYVSLRCMQIMSNGYRLYAGGGLLPGSNEEQEWEETEAKLEAMRSLIR